MVINIFVLLFIFPKFFFQHFFFNFFNNIFFSTFFLQIFFLNFFFKFFPQFFFKIFFPTFFQKFFFWGLHSRCLPVYRNKTDSMYLCHEKYDLQQAVEIGLQSCVIRYSSSVHTAHITLDVKSSIPSLQRIRNILFILLYFFWNLLYLIEVLKCFLDGI